jgi:hypothetical protein
VSRKAREIAVADQQRAALELEQLAKDYFAMRDGDETLH